MRAERWAVPNHTWSCWPRSCHGWGRVRALSRSGWALLSLQAPAPGAGLRGEDGSNVGGDSFYEYTSWVPALLKSPIHSCLLIPGPFPQKHPLVLVSAIYFHRDTIHL